MNRIVIFDLNPPEKKRHHQSPEWGAQFPEKWTTFLSYEIA